MRTFLLAIIFLFLNSPIFSQDYKQVDSIVDNYPKTFKSIQLLSDRIKQDFDTDIDKTRAAYYWIANNIAYDYHNYRNKVSNYKTISFDNEEDYERRLKNMKKNYAERCLRRKKAICEGYSQLLKFTLDNLDIKCEVISGFGKNQLRDIGWVTDDTNHAWNAVYLNNKWHLIDATWSTGNREDKPKVFKFNDFYFLTNPKQFIWSHYPEETKWQLLNKPVKKSRFFYAPIVYKTYYNSGLELFKMKGLIKANDKIVLIFNTIDENMEYSYQFDNEYSEPIIFKKVKGKYIATISKPKGFRGKLILFYQNKACLSFKVI